MFKGYGSLFLDGKKVTDCNLRPYQQQALNQIKKSQLGHIGWDGPGSDEQPLFSLRRFVWRVRFTIYGQKNCPIGWKNWWAFASDHAHEFGTEHKPEDGALEEIYAMSETGFVAAPLKGD